MEKNSNSTKKVMNYLNKEKYALVFEVIVILIGMLLAMTLDGIKDDYNVKKEKIENFKKDKSNIRDIYLDIRYEVSKDTSAILLMLEEIYETQENISSFARYKTTDAARFRQCKKCVESIFEPVRFLVDLRGYRKISSSPLYEWNSVYVNAIESTDENEALLSQLSDANFNIDYYYSIVEGRLQDVIKNIERDIQNNVDYFKLHSTNYHNGRSAIDLNHPIYLNMLVARMELMDKYSYDLDYLVSDARELLESLDLAISALDESME